MTTATCPGSDRYVNAADVDDAAMATCSQCRQRVKADVTDRVWYLDRHDTPVTTPTPTDRSVIDAAHLAQQREWSTATFGPGTRLHGVLDHIRKELGEIEAAPDDVTEWVDVIILAFDGAWRAGWEPQQIIDAIKAKQARNEARTWPDWRAMSQDHAIEHDRTGEDTPPVCATCNDVRTVPAVPYSRHWMDGKNDLCPDCPEDTNRADT